MLQLNSGLISSYNAIICDHDMFVILVVQELDSSVSHTIPSEVVINGNPSSPVTAKQTDWNESSEKERKKINIIVIPTCFD